ncbi:putative DNA-binding transcriptional regulator [Streptomyces sp. ADI96-02]|uniref:TetR/AcrR family transcriptional regulator n=1 Tax=unclassified Streptomyces TaxID=2593676 RepID=UPI000F5567CD|nr:TetR family transcriptional regulator [Streptomyces sp. ADI96-02]RPK69083.1 putative DNA-binding transcriptional regulator [Streptomyces sp. ADI96-02]
MSQGHGRGRRRGRPDTRKTIVDAARSRFLEDGYHAVTLRSVAADADVDIALIGYYFGSKKGLFGAALALPANPAELLADLLRSGDHSDFPERAARTVLRAWDDPRTGPELLSLLRRAGVDGSLSVLLREVLEAEVIRPLGALLGGSDAPQRAASFSAIMTGLVTSRYLLRLDPIASMSTEDVVAHITPLLGQALRGPGRTRRPPAATV